MPAPTISPLPPAPNRGNAPDLFVSRADALVAALALFVSDANEMGLFMDGVASASAANLAAQIALVASGGFSGTSTSSLSVGVGTKVLTIQTNRTFVPGSVVTVTATSAPAATFMTGVVTAYNIATGAMTVDVQTFQGDGTFMAWNLVLSGIRGLTGPAAPTGYAATSSTTAALAAGGRYRFTARITAGTLPASPGPSGDPIEIMSAIDAQANYHTITPNGAETVMVNGVAGSPYLLDVPAGEIIKLIPISGGWEQGN